MTANRNLTKIIAAGSSVLLHAMLLAWFLGSAAYTAPHHFNGSAVDLLPLAGDFAAPMAQQTSEPQPVLDAVTPSEPAAPTVDVAMADFDTTKQPDQHLSGLPVGEKISAALSKEGDMGIAKANTVPDWFMIWLNRLPPSLPTAQECGHLSLTLQMSITLDRTSKIIHASLPRSSTCRQLDDFVLGHLEEASGLFLTDFKNTDNENVVLLLPPVTFLLSGGKQVEGK